MIYDGSGRKLHEDSYIIRPEGWSIDPGAARIHGITDFRALREGVAMQVALGALQSALDQCDTLVAHNMAFDEKIVGAEFLRMIRRNPLDGKRRLCTMEVFYSSLKAGGVLWLQVAEAVRTA